LTLLFPSPPRSPPVQAFLDEFFKTTEAASASVLGAETENREARSARLKATMTDAAYASASVHYSSIFGTLEALYVKCKTNSREIVEVVSGRKPGAPSYTKLQSMCKAWVDTWESEFKLDADTMLLMLMATSGATRRARRGSVTPAPSSRPR
jgi:hypothetical protein